MDRVSVVQTLVDLADCQELEGVSLATLTTWHKGLALESAHTLLTRELSVLTVGHGHMLEDPQAAIEHAIRITEQLLAKEERKQPHVA